MHYGKAIKKKLIDAGLDQTWLAKELGLSDQAVSFMCSRRHLNTKKLHEVCNLLNISVMSMMVEGNPE